MPATPAQRSRAYAIRQKIKSGKASPDEIHWLKHTYEPSRNQKRAAPPRVETMKPAVKPLPSMADHSSVGAPQGEPLTFGPSQSEPMTPAAIQRAAARPDGYSPIRFIGDRSSASPGAAGQESPQVAQQCDCPGCTQGFTESALGGTVCKITGKRWWPPMEEETALEYAKAALKFIGWIIKLFRKDKQFVEPKETEIKALARGIRLFQMKRASWLGAFDDLVLIAGSVGGYGARAVNAPVKKKLAKGLDGKPVEA